jgi:hypothetical protein
MQYAQSREGQENRQAESGGTHQNIVRNKAIHRRIASDDCSSVSERLIKLPCER